MSQCSVLRIDGEIWGFLQCSEWEVGGNDGFWCFCEKRVRDEEIQKTDLGEKECAFDTNKNC